MTTLSGPAAWPTPGRSWRRGRHMPMGYTLLARQKSIPLGSVSAFWHVPSEPGTLMGYFSIRIPPVQVSGEISAPCEDAPDIHDAGPLVYTVEDYVAAGGHKPDAPFVPGGTIIQWEFVWKGGQILLDGPPKPEIPSLRRGGVSELLGEISRFLLNIQDRSRRVGDIKPSEGCHG